MNKISVLIVALTIFLSFATSHAGINDNYIAASDPDNPFVGNWFRSYFVTTRNGNSFRQMEIYQFASDNTFSVYYYEEGRKRPFEKRYGHYAEDKPLLILYGHKKGEVGPNNKVWKDCRVFVDQLTCIGYHNKSIPFRRWYKRPDKLEEPCCD